MKRSIATTAAMMIVSALALTGCGSKSAAITAPTNMARPMSPAYQPVQPANAPLMGNNAASATGKIVLQLSSLDTSYKVQATRQDVAAVEVRMTGAGLAEPLVKRMTAAELQTSNTIAFEGVPVGHYSISLAAFDNGGANIGVKSTDVTVVPNEETAVKLQLKLKPTVVAGVGRVSFDFEIIDGDEVFEEPAQDQPATQAEEPATEPEMDTEGMLNVEITDKEVVRKLLVLKRLGLTVKVTNENTTETLSGEVKIDFYKDKGIFTKTTTLVETQTQEIKNLPPGKSVELTFQSTESASDAEATVHTVLSTATATTEE